MARRLRPQDGPYLMNPTRRGGGILPSSVGLWLIPLLLVGASRALRAQHSDDNVTDVTGQYHFLSPDDTLGLLEEEGKLKGYVDVAQGEEESDAILSYPIVLGSRKGAQVEFKTAKIHQKYYRFAGTVERGTGRDENHPDYLRLVGDLEIITVSADTGQESVELKHVILKSMGKSERGEDQEAASGTEVRALEAASRAAFRRSLSRRWVNRWR
jgi:hypothetical protein